MQVIIPPIPADAGYSTSTGKAKSARVGGHVIRSSRIKLVECGMLSRRCRLHSLLPMNVAGPSWAHPVEYEEDLTRMIAQLDLTDIERLQAVYDDRVDILSDHEVAFTLLMQNAREIAQFNADRELAQRFAIDGVEELDLTLR